MWALLRELGVQFTKFAGFGAVGTLGHYIVLIALVDLVDSTPVLSSGVGALVGTIINYFLNHRYTFNSNKHHLDAAPKFFAVSMVGISINLLIMYILVSISDIYYLAAQVVATGVVLAWNFLGNRYWTFRSDLAVR